MRASEFDPATIQPVTSFKQLEQYIRYLKPTEKFYRIHGNYCGPGNRGGEPVDTIDAGCQLHDVCYMVNGYHSPLCDQELVDWAKNIDPNTLSRYQRGIRAAITQWFDKKLKRKMTTDRTRFNESWLTESPEGIETTNTHSPLVFNIRDLLNNGIEEQPTIDPHVKKIELSNSVYYWIEDDGNIQLAVELDKKNDNLTVRLTGKDSSLSGKMPYADKLYKTILDDSGKPLLFSDNRLTNDSKKVWKRLVASGNTVTVYDTKNPGQSRRTIRDPEELDQFWKMNDPSYQRWRYVLSESGSMTHEVMASFNTRRARELTTLGTDDAFC
jgi:hypothetical protein